MFPIPFFLIKFASIAVAGALGLILVHQAFEGWKQGLIDVAIVTQQAEEHQQELALRDKQLALLSEANANMTKEVQWARTYVQKQEETIEKLKSESSVQAQECFDLPIDTGFVR